MFHSGTQIHVWQSRKGHKFTFSKGCASDLCKLVSFHQLTAAEDKPTAFRNVMGTLGLILHIHTYS